MLNSKRILTYVEAIREATDQLMSSDRSVFVVGLGVLNGAAGTTKGLHDKYPDRVFDTPTSEAALTGVSVGAAIGGLRPIVHHDRVEFSLLAADQIFTQAAKWHYMFGGAGGGVPLTVRIVVGRQWGNGPQHSQALYSLFGTVRGLKVIIPSTPRMAKGLLVSAVRDKNPVIILEPRWLYGIREDVPEEIYALPLSEARIIAPGTDITVVAYGDGVLAAIEALSLVKQYISVELVDLVSINPVDYRKVFSSVKKTGRLLCIDTTNSSFNVGSEIISKIAQSKDLFLKNVPISIACPDVPCPTSTALSEFYYPTKIDVANAILRIFDKPAIIHPLAFEELHLPPSFVLP